MDPVLPHWPLSYTSPTPPTTIPPPPEHFYCAALAIWTHHHLTKPMQERYSAGIYQRRPPLGLSGHIWHQKFNQPLRQRYSAGLYQRRPPMDSCGHIWHREDHPVLRLFLRQPGEYTAFARVFLAVSIAKAQADFEHTKERWSCQRIPGCYRLEGSGGHWIHERSYSACACLRHGLLRLQLLLRLKMLLLRTRPLPMLIRSRTLPTPFQRLGPRTAISRRPEIPRRQNR